jgi:hypothetical protein
MAERKDRMALLSRYAKLHATRYGVKPDYNINREQWASDNLIESYGIYGCYDLLDYYFDASPSPSWKHFSNYTDLVVQAKRQVEEDKEERRERRKMARAWLNE